MAGRTHQACNGKYTLQTVGILLFFSSVDRHGRTRLRNAACWHIDQPTRRTKTGQLRKELSPITVIKRRKQ